MIGAIVRIVGELHKPDSEFCRPDCVFCEEPLRYSWRKQALDSDVRTLRSGVPSAYSYISHTLPRQSPTTPPATLTPYLRPTAPSHLYRHDFIESVERVLIAVYSARTTFKTNLFIYNWFAFRRMHSSDDLEVPYVLLKFIHTK